MTATAEGPPSSVSPRPTPSSTPAPSTTPPKIPSSPTVALGASQAQVINRLLDDSVSARDGVRSVLSHVWACQATEDDSRALRRAASIRRDLARQVDAAPVSDLPGGSHLATQLSRLWRLSAQANDRYLAWAETMSGCEERAYADDQYAAGARLSHAATRTKRAFVADWNALAADYDLPLRNADDL